jgi:hypothetical protein
MSRPIYNAGYKMHIIIDINDTILQKEDDFTGNTSCTDCFWYPNSLAAQRIWHTNLYGVYSI